MNSVHKKHLKIRELSVECHEHEMKTVFLLGEKKNCGSNQSRKLFIARGIAPDILLLTFFVFSCVTVLFFS